MKFEKVLIGIFAVIGFIVVCLGIGYIIGVKNQNPAPVSVEAPTSTAVPTLTSKEESDVELVATLASITEPTATPVPTVTPTPTPDITEIPQETKASISESDFYYDTDGKLQYTIDLIDFIKGIPNFSDLDNDQICKIIESQDFEGIMKTGKAINDIEGHLHKKLSDRALSEYIKNSVLGSLIDTPVEDTNKGGSDENEKIEDYEEPAIDFDDKVDYTPSSGETDNTGSNEDSNETTSDDYSSLGEDKYKPQNPEVEIENEPEVEDAVRYTYTIINQWMFVTDNANTRLGPSTDFDLSSSVAKGKEVKVCTRCNETGWYTIINNGGLEFIAPQFISETAPSTPTSTPTPKPTSTPTPKPTKKPTPKPTAAPKLPQEQQELLDSYKEKYPNAWLSENTKNGTVDIHHNDGSGHVSTYEKDKETGELIFKFDGTVPNEMFYTTPTPTPIVTPFPTGTMYKTLSFITRDSEGNELAVETMETSGSYVQWKKGSEAYYVPDGLDNKDISIVLDNQEEAWAWQEKYPDARYTTLTTTDANGNKTVRYVLDLDGWTSYKGEIRQEELEKLLNSDITLW